MWARWMDGTDEWVDGYMNGWMNGQIDGWMNGPMDDGWNTILSLDDVAFVLIIIIIFQ